MVKRSRKLCNNDAALTACKKIMHSLILSSVPKLNSVLGFRPTDDGMSAERDAALAAFETALHESPSPYKPNPPPKRKAG